MVQRTLQEDDQRERRDYLDNECNAIDELITCASQLAQTAISHKIEDPARLDLIKRKIESLNEQMKSTSAEILMNSNAEELNEEEKEQIKEQKQYDQLCKSFMPYMLLYQLANSS